MPANNLDTLVELMLQTGRQIQGSRVADRFSPYTALRLEALGFIASAKEPTMRNLADYFGITPPSATSLVAGLAKSGAVIRKPDKTDRRVTRLAITAAGRKAYETGHAQLTAHMKGIFGNLTPTEREALIKIFTKLSRIYTHD